MVKHFINKSILNIFLFIPFLGHTQEGEEKENNFNLSGQIRPRFEFRQGVFQPVSENAKPAILVSQRTRLVFNYQYKDQLSFQISPQAVSIWGQSNIVQGVEQSGSQFALFEAWAKLKFSSNTSLQVGRQVISLDDERFYGGLDWAQGARAHDALSLHYDKKNYELKLFLGYSQNYKELYGNNISNVSGSLHSTKDAAPYKWMQTVWGKIPLYKNAKLSLLITNLGFQNAVSSADTAKTYFQQTYGANYTHSGSHLSLGASAYYQGGDNAAGKSTSAYLLAGNIGYKLSKWNFIVGSDFLSGNDIGKVSDINKAFIPYYGTNHKFYGSMDYYYAGNPHKNVSLWDNYLKAGYKPNDALSFSLAFHQFVTPNTVIDSNHSYNKNLGQEMDLDFIYTINKFSSITGGYSLYANTSTIDFLKGVSNTKPIQNWVWMSLNISPKLLQTKF